MTDVQQHQHRFNVNQQSQFNRNPFNARQQSSFVQQPALSFAIPPQTSIVQTPRFQQQLPSPQTPPVFRQNIPQVNPFQIFHKQSNFIPNFNKQTPVVPLQQNSQNTRQTQFQRSVQNQVGQVSFNQPQQQFNQFSQQPNNPFAFQEPQFNNFQNHPAAAGLIQQQLPPVRPQQNFQPNGQFRFPQTQQNQFIPQNTFQPEAPRVIPSVPAPQTQFQNFAPQNNFQQQPIQNPFVQPTQALPSEQRSNLFHDTRTEEQRQKDSQSRQKLIEKHEKFAQKYYQKQQVQVQKQHEEFLKKQQKVQQELQEKLRPQQSQLVQNYNRHQGVQPTDLSAFEKSVQQYYQQNPTTTSKTQAPVSVTTTSNPLTVIPLKKSNNKKSEIKTINAEDIQQLLQGNRQNLLNQLKQEAKVQKSQKAQKSPLGRDDLLKQLQKALSEENQDLGGKNYTTEDIVLPNGEQVQVIRTTDPELIRKAKAGQVVEQTVATTTPPPLSLEDLAKSGILPPGTDFEVIRQSDDGLQRVQKVPQQKKVTFVYLEEQEDGSYQVKGVKGNGEDKPKTSGAEVDSILKRIKAGEIQLPPTVKKVEAPIEIPTPPPSTTTQSTTVQQTRTSFRTIVPSTSVPKNHRPAATVNSLIRSSSVAPPQTITPARQSTRGSSIFQYSFSATTPKYEDNGRSPYSTLPTFATSERSNFFSVTPRVQRLSTTEHPEYDTAGSINHIHNVNAQKYVSSTRIQAASATSASPSFASSPYFTSPSYSPTFTTTPRTTLPPVPTTTTQAPDLSHILKDNGLFAMAKYLRQSGLDSILNETGPYTIFAPTDKAFKSLLVQLGGPEKAEEKFKNNPRLLSGLLLHHVIPGAFKLDELQDEMTGVSLAGTQLRVNQYQMQDTEWNDVKITTINGATVSTEPNDIIIPQGVAHAVERVMFPLPVGDILQTLQSDRERRFTHFLRAVFASNMADTLQNKGALLIS